MKRDCLCPTCANARNIIQSWLDSQGHDRCWYYPEVFEKLATLFELDVRVDRRLPPRADFEEGCRRYQASEYDRRD